MRLLLSVFLASLLVLPARVNAQQDTSSQLTSVTVGYLDDTFEYIGTDDDFTYDFRGAASALMVSSENASLLFSYGVQDPTDTFPGLRSIIAAATVGENSYLTDDVARLPLRLYIPIRLNLGYRGVAGMDDPEGPDIDVPSLHLGHLGLAVGGGAEFRLPRGLPIVGDNLVGVATVTRGLGGMADLRSNLDEVRLIRTTNFNVEFRLERLLGGTAGITVGFTLREKAWGINGIDSAFDVLDVLVGRAENFERRSLQSLFRIGANF